MFTRFGYSTLSVIAVIAFICISAGFFISNNYVKFFLIAIPTAFLIFSMNFFRDPDRTPPDRNDVVVSPADGTVLFVKEVDENRFINGKAKQVSIFMSPTNVHINWVPVPGKVTYMKHKDGEFYAAFKDKSAEENERFTTAVKLKDGREIVMRQVAGAMARRIINYVELGDTVDQTIELGFIRFGSRVDLFLPLDTKLQVKLKDKVVGSQTIIGKLDI